MADDLNTKAFEVHITGDRTGKLWSGKFRTKIHLAFDDRCLRDKMTRDLLMLGPDEKANQASIEANNIAMMLADLRVRLVSTPDWWTAHRNGGGLEDDNVLLAIYNEAIKVEEDAIKALEDQAKKVAAQVKKPKSDG